MNDKKKEKDGGGGGGYASSTMSKGEKNRKGHPMIISSDAKLELVGKCYVKRIINEGYE